MRKWLYVLGPAVVAAVLAATLLVPAFKPKVTVTTGERVYCTYGEMLSSNVRSQKVSSDEAKSYSVKRRTETCEKHQRLEDLYAVAQEALARGDVDSAKKALTPLVAEDSGFRKASEQLKTIERGKKPASDGATPDKNEGTGGTDGSKPDKPAPKPNGPSASMLGYMPDSIPGFTAEPVLAEDFSLTRQYAAKDSDRFLSLVILAQQYRDTKAAELAYRGHKASYYKDAETVKIDGRSVYVGTNGRTIAGLVFRNGSVVVAMELAPRSGSPAEVKDELVGIAKDVLE